MGRIDGEIPDELEKKFRLKAVEKFGGRRGSLNSALKAAIEEWIIHG